MQDVFRAQEKALSSCGRDLGHEPRVAVDKTTLGGGPGWQDLGCPSRMFGACAPWGLLFSPQVGVPLENQEIEDIVIYLSSLGKHNSITMDILANIDKQWSLAQQAKVLPATRECTYPPPALCLHFPIL